MVEGRLRIARRADVGLLGNLLARARELDRLQGDPDRLRGQFRLDPGAIAGVDRERLSPRRGTRYFAFLDGRQRALAAELGRQIKPALTILRYESVEIDDRSYAVRYLLDGTRDRPTSIGMGDQANIRQILPSDHVDDVGNVGIEIDAAADQMRAFAEAGERRRKNLVPAPDEQIRHAPPAPTAVPGAVHEHKSLCRALRLRDGSGAAHRGNAGSRNRDHAAARERWLVCIRHRRSSRLYYDQRAMRSACKSTSAATSEIGPSASAGGSAGYCGNPLAARHFK